MLFKASKIAKLDSWGEKGKVDKIIPFAKDKDPVARTAAAKALGLVDSDESLNALISLLHDRDFNVRMAVVESLVKIKRKAAAEHIRHAYSATSEPEFVEACKKALTSFMDLQKT